MGKHTPGPWSRAWVAGAIRHINRNVELDLFYDASEDDEGLNHPRRNEADYDLITAAPELLEALRMARGWVAGFGDDDERAEADLIIIDAVLAKAGGK